MQYYCDEARHLVCMPYTVENLHLMAADLGIKRCWFHANASYPHYDIPKRRIAEVTARCKLVSTRDILRIVKGEVDGMKDAFNRPVNVGDVVVYSTRSASCQYMFVARVLAVTEHNAKVRTFAGTGYNWTNARYKWNRDTKKHDTIPPTSGYTTTLRAASNMVLANGIDTHAIVDSFKKTRG